MCFKWSHLEQSHFQWNSKHFTSRKKYSFILVISGSNPFGSIEIQIYHKSKCFCIVLKSLIWKWYLLQRAECHSLIYEELIRIGYSVNQFKNIEKSVTHKDEYITTWPLTFTQLQHICGIEQCSPPNHCEVTKRK